MSSEKDYGPVGRSSDLGDEGAPSERPHLHIHHVAGDKPVVYAPSQVPPSRKSASQQRLKPKK
jgi:hypothetical protein